MYLYIMYLDILRDVVLCVDVLVYIIAYSTTLAADDIIWIYFIISVFLMYVLMRLCIGYSFMIMDIVHEI